MPPTRPPALCPGIPVIDALIAGTIVYRVHDEKFSGIAPNPTVPTAWNGGRFDSPDGRYASLYFALTPDGAIAEAICRDLPLDGNPRIIPRAKVEGRRLSQMRVTADLAFVAAHGAGLAQLGQDIWLTSTYPDEYSRTRQWAAAIQGWAHTRAGIAYRCRHNNDEIAYLAWTPRSMTRHPAIEVEHSWSFGEDSRARSELRRVAREHNAVVYVD